MIKSLLKKILPGRVLHLETQKVQPETPSSSLTESRKKYLYIDQAEMARTIREKPPRGVSGASGVPRLLISLTSIPSRMADIHFAVYSLLNQTLKPDAVILYLGQEHFPDGENGLPEGLLLMKQYGLQIRFVQDRKPYTKFIYALAEYPDSFIVTADDDIYYPEDWLEKLWKTHEAHPDCILAHRAHRIKMNPDGSLLSYQKWGFTKGLPEPSFLNFLTGVGGVLYPPRCLHEDAGNAEKFVRLSEFADDIWFWACAVRKGTKICCVPDGYPKPVFVNIDRELRLTNAPTLAMKNNTEKNANDVQLKNVLTEYPEILDKLHAEIV